MPDQSDFDHWFARATGNPPYVYQRALAERDGWPSVLEVPTGSGKTQAVIGAWLSSASAESDPDGSCTPCRCALSSSRPRRLPRK